MFQWFIKLNVATQKCKNTLPVKYKLNLTLFKNVLDYLGKILSGTCTYTLSSKSKTCAVLSLCVLCVCVCAAEVHDTKMFTT